MSYDWGMFWKVVHHKKLNVTTRVIPKVFAHFFSRILVTLLNLKEFGTRQEQTQRNITHTTTNTQPAFGSVLIKGRTKFKGSKNVLWLIQDRLLQIEFAFNYWNISAYLLKKWIYYCEIIMLENNRVNYFKFCPTFDMDCLHFWKCDAIAPCPWWVPMCMRGETHYYKNFVWLRSVSHILRSYKHVSC